MEGPRHPHLAEQRAASPSFQRVIGCACRTPHGSPSAGRVPSWSHEKGVPGKVVAQLMGHANVDTTLNVYTQVLDGPVCDAVEKIGGNLFTIVH